jgi:branched-chain amino acid aminotransferase
MVVFLNGEFVAEARACVPVGDRGFLYADGVFETARLHRGRFFRLDHHLARLRRSGEVLGIAVPPDPQLAAIAEELARRNDLDDASLRITLSRGAAAAPGTFLVTLQPMPADWRERAARGWSVCVARTRRPSASAIPADIKALGRTYALLARREAAMAGADDAILLSADGFVAEGPTWNIFWRNGGQLCTPALDIGILGGITRGIILELASRLALPVEEGRFPPEALGDADEIFATMTSAGVVPIIELDGRRLPAAQSIAADLQDRYWRLVGEECRPE